MKKKEIFLGSVICLFAASCHFEHKHPVPPLPQNCVITYTYRDNVAISAIEPVVTCSVRDANPYAQAECYMTFRADGLPNVTDRKFKTADFFGDADLSVSNGNCYGGIETINLYAECIVDGQLLNVLSTGDITCGG